MLRQFESGACRDDNKDKPDYEGFLNPLVIVEFGKYMHKNRIQADGNYRDSDNWQKGIPREALMGSLMRHTVDVWLHHRGYPEVARESIMDALCAILFNTEGYILDILLEQRRLAEEGIE